MTMLLPFINKQLNGVIWRMEVDDISGTLFLETRTTDKQVAFTSLDLTTGQTNFEDLTLPERWLAGIEAGYDGILLLHNYQSENTPVHKGVIAIDNKGQTIWNNYTYAFNHLSVNGPVLYNIQIQPKKLFVADIKTGSVIRPFEQIIDTEPENFLSFPRISATSFLTGSMPVEAHGNIIHYLDHNNFRIVSLHSFKDGQLKQHLFIMDADKVVYEDLLNTGIQKMQPESFILYKNSLVYIKNRSELKAINL
jgi:hypothetical protein